jgi:hypothetical protein
MSDRLPGSSFSNPITYRGWRIYAHDCGPTPFHYAFGHDDYEPGTADDRYGHSRTVEEAKREIDAYEGYATPLSHTDCGDAP